MWVIIINEFKLKKVYYFPVFSVLWVVIILGAFLIHLCVLRKNSESLVQTGSEAFFKLLAATHQWNDNHKFVYVPITETMQPNPYITHVGSVIGGIGINTSYHENCFPHTGGKSIEKLIIIYSLILLVGFFLLLYILSLSKRHRLDVETKYKELQDINAAKDKFISVVAHDLKTPAANIEALAETLKERFKDLSEEERRNYIDLLVESTKTHNDLLKTLLDLSWLRSGGKQYDPERLDVRKLVDEVLEQTKLQAQRKQISQLNHADECYAKADKNMITTVIRNLVVNGIKFTHQGGQIIVGAKKTGTVITVSITDTGVGIPETQKNNIFGVNSNKSTVGTTNETGTGLGLLLCKEYVERNEGHIWLESKEGTGTTFFFTLPEF